MSRTIACATVLGASLLWNTAPVQAHFQVLLPTTDIVTAEGSRTVDFDIRFTHPMEWGPVMEMGKPARFGVLANGVHTDLGTTLHKREIEGKSAYTASYTMKMPGDYVFYIDPAPYWEPAEGKMIIHYTKVVVDAFDAEEGWDALVGQPVEIEPLVRPYGLWTGNTFQGIVRQNGKPVPYATVEVEYYNQEQSVSPPADPYVTQVIKADGQGVFSYTMPRAGWWGFAALIDGDEQLPGPDGAPADVELGGLIWVRTRDMR